MSTKWIGLQFLSILLAVFVMLFGMKNATKKEHQTDAQIFFEEGKNLANKGRLTEAEASFSKAIDSNPKYADAYNNRAILEYTQNRWKEAEISFQKALKINPQKENAFNNLALLMNEQDRLRESLFSWSAALKINPTNGNTLYNIGNVQYKLARYKEAAAHWSDAMKINPHDSNAKNNVGALLFNKDHLKEAEFFFSSAIESNPQFALAHFNLHTSLWGQRRFDEAIDSLRNASSIEPNNPRYHHMLQARDPRSKKRIKQASVEYVAAEFDEFADTFEATLVEKLQYRAPELIGNALAAALAENKDRKFDIIDFGCGSGLIGPVVQKYKKTLIGIDLSEKMLAKAKEYNRGYTHLILGGFEMLEKFENSADIIVSSDVLVYSGDLTMFFNAATRALRKESGLRLLVATVEALETATAQQKSKKDKTSDWNLLKSGRYAHSKAYIERKAEENHFNIISLEFVSTRKESGADIGGWLFIMSLK
eukprot:g4251.t1